MEKMRISPKELLEKSREHASAAMILMNETKSPKSHRDEAFELITPCLSLWHIAFELLLKAFILSERGKLIQVKSMLDLCDFFSCIELSTKDKSLLQMLVKYHALHKGYLPDFSQSNQELMVFCAQLQHLFKRLLDMSPIELLPEYQYV